MLDVTFRLTASPLSGPVRYGELSRVLGVPEGGQVPLADARAAVLELRRGKGMLLDDADPDTRSAGLVLHQPDRDRGQYAELAPGSRDSGSAVGRDERHADRDPALAGRRRTGQAVRGVADRAAGFTRATGWPTNRTVPASPPSTRWR